MPLPSISRECNDFTSIMMFQASLRRFYTSCIATNSVIPGRLGEANPEFRDCGARLRAYAFRVPRNDGNPTCAATRGRMLRGIKMCGLARSVRRVGEAQPTVFAHEDGGLRFASPPYASYASAMPLKARPRSWPAYRAAPRGWLGRAGR